MMNLYLSAAEYDYHTLLKVAEMAGLAGIIGAMRPGRLSGRIFLGRGEMFRL